MILDFNVCLNVVLATSCVAIYHATLKAVKETIESDNVVLTLISF